MRVLVTGHRGYIGSVLTCVLRHARFEVVGLDSDLYAGCDFGRVSESVPHFEMDLREIEPADLLSFDAIVHLAALPEDFQSPDRSELIEEVNHLAAVRLAESARAANVTRFVLASDCAVYGRVASRPGAHSGTDETHPPHPASSYARAKFRCEQDLMELADPFFAPVIFRLGTVYGVSPRLRLDLEANEMVASAVAHGRVSMDGGAAGWRSLLHVEDLCRAFAVVLAAPHEIVSGKVFNLAHPDQQLRLIELADAVVEAVPCCTRGPVVDRYDERSLRLDSSCFARTFPEWKPRWDLPTGIRQLHQAFVNGGITPGDLRSARYRRALRLHEQLESGFIDGGLRRAVPATA